MHGSGPVDHSSPNCNSRPRFTRHSHRRSGLTDLPLLKIRHCLDAVVCGHVTLVTRTGYTGELGYELYLPAEGAMTIWSRLLEAGQPLGMKPAGLGARDLLRLEMAYLLYGNDMDEGTTPIEAGADWVVKFDKGEFIGRTPLLAQHSNGPSRRLVAFELVEKAVPRHGFKILSAQDQQAVIGEVTSGNLSPILQKGIGMGYVTPAASQPGSSILIDIRGKSCPAVVVKPPFYKNSQARHNPLSHGQTDLQRYCRHTQCGYRCASRTGTRSISR
ncbi:MAG: glycine cleavage T C-terminal barrel domain-containing protein [Nitrospira sp.]